MSLRICGNCMHADQRLESHEIQKLQIKAHFKQQYSTYLVFLRRYANPLRDAKVLCQREKINIGLLDEVCAYWRPHCQRSKFSV